jgi:hypothetical protein
MQTNRDRFCDKCWFFSIEHIEYFCCFGDMVQLSINLIIPLDRVHRLAFGLLLTLFSGLVSDAYHRGEKPKSPNKFP